MTTIAILGSGRVAASLAGGLSRSGHAIVIGSRDPDGVNARWQGPRVTFAEPANAIDAAEVVFNALPGDVSLAQLSALEDALADKVLVDLANATGRDEAGRPSGLLYPADSLGERLQAALPSTRVVKALNTMLFPVIGDPSLLAAAPTAFLSGDDMTAKARVRSLLADMGWREDWVLDLGGIASARGPEAVMLMVPSIITARGMKPFAFTVAA